MRRVRLGAVLALAVAGGLRRLGGRRQPADGRCHRVRPHRVRLHRRREANRTGRALGERPPDTHQVGKPADLLGRPEIGFPVRTDENLHREDLHSLPPRGCEGRVEAGDVSDRRHVPIPQRVPGAQGPSDARQLAIPGGGVAVVDANHPESVHLAYPESITSSRCTTLRRRSRSRSRSRGTCALWCLKRKQPCLPLPHQPAVTPPDRTSSSQANEPPVSRLGDRSSILPRRTAIAWTPARKGAGHA